jgi:hypothetical protein
MYCLAILFNTITRWQQQYFYYNAYNALNRR